MRGQSRGAKKSMFSFFGGGQQDESGQVSTIRKIGYFKATIDIKNEAQRARYNSDKNRVLKDIFHHLDQIYAKVHGTKFEFSLDCVESSD